MARIRVVRVDHDRKLSTRPRRARCSACRTTHVLLPDWLLVRRGYAGQVIWQALVAHANGMGYRRIALRLRLPETTVRDWLRAFRRIEPRRLAGPGHTAASAVLAVQRKNIRPAPCRVAALRTNGRLLCNTSPPHGSGGKASHRPP
jgi:hypothetical protein